MIDVVRIHHQRFRQFARGSGELAEEQHPFLVVTATGADAVPADIGVVADGAGEGEPLAVGRDVDAIGQRRAVIQPARCAQGLDDA